MTFTKWAITPGDGYKAAQSDIAAEDLNFVTRYALWREEVAPPEAFTDEQSPGMLGVYKDPVFQFLHARLWPRIEEVTGLTLLPSYSYYRVYRPGAVLGKHKDRPACEVSATLLVGANYEPTWPLFIEGEQIIQQAGDVAVYRGCEVEHWREPMIGPRDSFQVQAFVHYVDANGPYAMCAGDEQYGPLGWGLRVPPV